MNTRILFFNHFTLFLPRDRIHSVEFPVIWIELDVGGSEAELLDVPPRLHGDELEDPLGVRDEGIPSQIQGRGIFAGTEAQQVRVQVHEEGAGVALLS